MHGKPGKNSRIHPNGTQDELGPLAHYHAQVHERLQIYTPGGGGFGSK
jgi:N-methylhydantoinase B/oxoprolinase/acetone carboxylase alpha subunit